MFERPLGRFGRRAGVLFMSDPEPTIFGDRQRTGIGKRIGKPKVAVVDPDVSGGANHRSHDGVAAVSQTQRALHCDLIRDFGWIRVIRRRRRRDDAELQSVGENDIRGGKDVQMPIDTERPDATKFGGSG